MHFQGKMNHLFLLQKKVLKSKSLIQGFIWSVNWICTKIYIIFKAAKKYDRDDWESCPDYDANYSPSSLISSNITQEFTRCFNDDSCKICMKYGVELVEEEKATCTPMLYLQYCELEHVNTTIAGDNCKCCSKFIYNIKIIFIVTFCYTRVYHPTEFEYIIYIF